MENPLITKYRKDLLYLSEELKEKDVKKLKFLCKDHMTVTEREDIEDGMDLFEVLEEKGLISSEDVKFLDAILGEIGRCDLQLKLREMVTVNVFRTETSLGSKILKKPADFSSNMPQPNVSAAAAQTKQDIPRHFHHFTSLHSASSSSKSRTSNLNPPASQSWFEGTLPKSGRLPILTSPQPTPRQEPGKSDTKAWYSQDEPMQVETSPLEAKWLKGGDVSYQKMGDVMLSFGVISQTPVGVEKEVPCGSLMDDVEIDAPSPPRMKDDDGIALSKNATGVLSQDVGALKVEAVSRELVTNEAYGQSLQGRGAVGGHFFESAEEGQTGKGVDEEVDVTCVTLRDYQKELAFYPLATSDNYIICAPTGSGKTITSASICHKRYQLHLTDPTQKKHFKALFIVNIRHLTHQQKYAFQEYFQDILAVRTLGEQQSFEDALMVDEPVPVVLMLTAQIFVNALHQKAVKLQDLNMLIFDECHHTDLSHPYNTIMKNYLKQKSSSSQGVGEHNACLPQVIGLSASLGVGRGQNLGLMHVVKLCANMDVRDVIRVRQYREQLASFVKVPEQDDIISVPPRDASLMAFRNLLLKIMRSIEEELGESGRNLPVRGCQPYENEVVSRQESSSKHEEIIAYQYLNACNRTVMLYEDLPVNDCLQILKTFHASRSLSQDKGETDKEQIFKALYDTNLAEMESMASIENEDSNPKLKELIGLLAEQFSQNTCSKGIILTRMKIATVSLCEFIRASSILKKLPCSVIPERLVGQGVLEEYAMTESQQKMVLDSFRQENGCNVLVATDIAQEGLDMPACNFVIRYNFVSNEIGTVQSKGRARAQGSKCFLIVERGSANELRELENREKVRLMEKVMKAFEGLTEEQRLKIIKEKQEEIIAEMLESERQKKQRVSGMNLEETIIQCAECNRFICTAADLRRKGAAGYVTCIDPTLKDRVTVLACETVRFRDTERVGLIMCGNPTCKNRLGTKEVFHLRSTSEGFGLGAKNFRVKFPEGGEKKLKQWKQLPIEEDEDL